MTTCRLNQEPSCSFPSSCLSQRRHLDALSDDCTALLLVNHAVVCKSDVERMQSARSTVIDALLDGRICARRHWLGGHSDDTKVGSAVILRSAVRCVMQIGTILRDTLPEPFADWLTTRWPTVTHFVEFISDDDDDLMALMCVLVEMVKRNDSSFPYDISSIFTQIWASIAFDVDIVIEWLMEQAEFCIVMKRYAQFLANIEKRDEKKEEMSGASFEEEELIAHPCQPNDEHTLCLDILERVGSYESSVKLTFCTRQVPTTVTSINRQSIKFDSLSDGERRTREMLGDLYEKLKKYTQSDVFPYNVRPLLNSLSQYSEE